MTVRPPLDIRPWDRYRCQGCERDLPVDGAGRFSDEAISGCEGACDWDLLGRGSRPGGTVSSEPDGAVSPGPGSSESGISEPGSSSGGSESDSTESGRSRTS